MKIEIGKKYRNIHTDRVVTVVQKVFFNIGYLEEDESSDKYPHYDHYKSFQRHWVEVDTK